MGGKTQTTTQQQTNTPTGIAQLGDIWNRVQQVASTPYQPYTGQLVAGLTPTQQAGIQGITNAQGAATPYFNQAAQYATEGASTIDPSSIQKYMNPYTQDVINATQANFNQNNAIQRQGVIGNAAAQGALGGDRVGVAQGELARQQGLAQNPVIAGLNQQNYTQALQAAQADRAAKAQGAYTFGALAPSVQNAQISGAQAQIGAGGLEQGTNQAALTAAYQQYLQQQAFPYQQAGFLASAGLPAVNSMGGTTHGTTTAPGPSILGQIAGLGMTGLGIAGATGGFGSNGWLSNVFGGGSSPNPSYGYTGTSSSPFAGYPGATTGYMGGTPYPIFADGGRVEKAAGGPLIDLSPNDYVRQGFGDTKAAIDSGAFDPTGANAMGPMAFQTPSAPIPPSNPESGLAPTPENPYTTATSAAPEAIPDTGEDAELPPEAVPTSGLLPFASSAPPSEPEGTGIFGISKDANLGLLAAGLGTLASRSPFALSAIGEGGLTGLKTYAQQKQQRQSAEQEARRLAQQAEQFSQNLGLHKETLAETIRRNTEAEKARQQTFNEMVRQHGLAAMQPVKLGVDAIGREIYGVKDPTTNTYRIIDPKTGQLTDQQPKTPIGPVSQNIPEEEGGIPATAQPVSGEGTRNEEFLKSLGEADPNLPSMIKKIADYEINPASLSTKGGHRERILAMVSRYDPEFNQAMYPARAQALKEFTSGGPQSPSSQIVAGNTAVQHAGDMSDAAEKMKALPGVLTKVANAGVPFISYAAAQLKNKSVRGTPEGQALADFMTARNHFAEEVTKFYAGSQGSEAERARALNNLDEAKSVEELRAAIATEAKLMAGKVNGLQGKWKNAMGGVSGWQAALRRANVDDFPVMQQKSQEAIQRINDRAASSVGSTHGAQRVKQNGHTYEKQPDGSYKAID